jgi:hypothetical protein
MCGSDAQPNAIVGLVRPGRSYLKSGNVDELLGGVTLDEKVAVIQSFEVNLDDISAGVVDPHEAERIGNY